MYGFCFLLKYCVQILKLELIRSVCGSGCSCNSFIMFLYFFAGHNGVTKAGSLSSVLICGIVSSFWCFRNGWFDANLSYLQSEINMETESKYKYQQIPDFSFAPLLAVSSHPFCADLNRVQTYNCCQSDIALCESSSKFFCHFLLEYALQWLPKSVCNGCTLCGTIILLNLKWQPFSTNYKFKLLLRQMRIHQHTLRKSWISRRTYVPF